MKLSQFSKLPDIHNLLNRVEQKVSCFLDLKMTDNETGKTIVVTTANHNAAVRIKNKGSAKKKLNH